MGCSKSSKIEGHTNIGLPHEKIQSQINYLTLQLKELGKKEESKVSRDIVKSKAEIK